MKIVVAPDSFKGTLSAFVVSESIAQELRKKYEGLDIVTIPLADGGEGTIDCVRHAIGGRLITTWVTSPFLGSKVKASVLVNGDTAIVESARAIGLPLIGKNKNPLFTTTFGVGEMIKIALNEGVKNFIIALGGSSTNEGGIGMAIALGAKAYNKEGKEYIPTGGSLNKLAMLDVSGMDKRLNGVNVITLCDVTNPLCGANGASYVYAPQKGAKEAVLPILDAGLARLADVCEESMGISSVIKTIPGAGAAGGLGFGTMAFLGARIKSGIETIMKIVSFEDKIADADIIITGEGKFDDQSLMGKVVGGVANKAMVLEKKVVVVAGKSTFATPPQGITAIIETNPLGLSMSEVACQAEAMLRTAIKETFELDAICK